MLTTPFIHPDRDFKMLEPGDLVIMSRLRAEGLSTEHREDLHLLARVGNVDPPKVGLLFVWPNSGKVETGMYDPDCILAKVEV